MPFSSSTVTEITAQKVNKFWNAIQEEFLELTVPAQVPNCLIGGLRQEGVMEGEKIFGVSGSIGGELLDEKLKMAFLNHPQFKLPDGSLDQDKARQFISTASALILDLYIGLPELRKQEYGRQTIAYYSSSDFRNDAPFDTNRLQHSLNVARGALIGALRSEVPQAMILYMVASAVCHDIGHPFGGHSMEERTRAKNPDLKDFDHDFLGAFILSSKRAKEIFSRYGLDHKICVALQLGERAFRKEEQLRRFQTQCQRLGLPHTLAVFNKDNKPDRQLITCAQIFHTLIMDRYDKAAYTLSDARHSIPSINEEHQGLTALLRDARDSFWISYESEYDRSQEPSDITAWLLSLKHQRILSDNPDAVIVSESRYWEYTRRYMPSPTALAEFHAIIERKGEKLPPEFLVYGTEEEFLEALSEPMKRTFHHRILGDYYRLTLRCDFETPESLEGNQYERVQEIQQLIEATMRSILEPSESNDRHEKSNLIEERLRPIPVIIVMGTEIEKDETVYFNPGLEPNRALLTLIETQPNDSWLGVSVKYNRTENSLTTQYRSEPRLFICTPRDRLTQEAHRLLAAELERDLADHPQLASLGAKISAA